MLKIAICMCSELWLFETFAVFTLLSYERASIQPLPIRVEVMFRQRKMYPIVPMPPNSPFFGTNLQGPSSKKLVIPRVSIAVVFVIFAVEFMNTTANLTKTTAINDNTQFFFVFLANLSHLEQKNFQNFFSKLTSEM